MITRKEDAVVLLHKPMYVHSTRATREWGAIAQENALTTWERADRAWQVLFGTRTLSEICKLLERMTSHRRHVNQPIRSTPLDPAETNRRAKLTTLEITKRTKRRWAITIHHATPKERYKLEIPAPWPVEAWCNKLRMKRDRHVAWHYIFRNMTLEEVCAMLRRWVD